jgi:hypothetical protein
MSTFYYIFNFISNLLYNSNVFEITMGTNKLDRSSDLKGSDISQVIIMNIIVYIYKHDIDDMSPLELCLKSINHLCYNIIHN